MPKHPEKDLPQPAAEAAPPSRREFLGNAAAMAAAVAAVPVLAACDAVAGTEPEAAAEATPVSDGARFSLAGGRDPGVTLHNMMASTLGTATDVKIPALEKGISSTYIQRVVTDTDRTGTGLSTVLKKSYKFANGATVQVIVQDSRGRSWPARTIYKQSDLVYAMKDALATNPLHLGVLRESLTAGCAVVAIAKCHVIQFPDSVASDYYGNHLDIASRGLCDLFNATVGGIKIASTTQDPKRC